MAKIALMEIMGLWPYFPISMRDAKIKFRILLDWGESSRYRGGATSCLVGRLARWQN